MKKLLALACLTVLATGVYAQGLVNFANGPTSRINTNAVAIGGTTGLTAGPVGAYYYALFTSPVGANNFTFAGVLGTNTIAAGRFNSGASAVAVAGWSAGTSRDYLIRGWSSSLGTTWGDVSAQWNNGVNPAWTSAGFFGSSTVGTGIAGGTDAGGISYSPLNPFNLAGGIATGFDLNAVVVIPEPSSLALLGLGAAALLIRRRK